MNLRTDQPLAQLEREMNLWLTRTGAPECDICESAPAIVSMAWPDETFLLCGSCSIAVPGADVRLGGAHPRP